MPSHTPPKSNKCSNNRSNKALNIAKTGVFKQSVGRAGEDFVCDHIPCETCGFRKWINLNNVKHNFPGVDLKCVHCGTYAQVKTGNSTLIPHRTGWKIPTSPATVRDTLKTYKLNMRYIAVTYNNKHQVTEVCVTEPLSCKNIFHTENCIVSYDLHHWTPKMLRNL